LHETAQEFGSPGSTSENGIVGGTHPIILRYLGWPPFTA
jgi:hypothetical protein